MAILTNFVNNYPISPKNTFNTKTTTKHEATNI